MAHDIAELYHMTACAASQPTGSFHGAAVFAETQTAGRGRRGAGGMAQLALIFIARWSLALCQCPVDALSGLSLTGGRYVGRGDCAVLQR